MPRRVTQHAGEHHFGVRCQERLLQRRPIEVDEHRAHPIAAHGAEHIVEVQVGMTQTGREREEADGLACELAPLIARYRDLWARRNRPGGLDASVRLLENLPDEYSKDSRRGDLSP